MDLVNKLWGFCNKLRHDGVDPSDYIEQLTYLLFLKMAEEKGIFVPNGFDWASLKNKETKNLLPHLEAILEKLKNQPGILGDIFSEPVSRVRNTTILKALISEIDAIQWTKVDADVVGLAFEQLIGKVANEGKKGAGQYFTPRPLIRSIVNVMKPDPLEDKDFTLGDVAVGTAGFLVMAFEWFSKGLKGRKLSKTQLNKIQNLSYYGEELVARPRRLALMNMFLHGINARIRQGDAIYDPPDESEYTCILTNPPFGNKGSNQIPNRDFPIKTSDKQLNFIQHVISKLKNGGRAAIVLPDSCLSSESAKKIWAYYLDPSNSGKEVCNLHTLLKLPEGIFASYANGVKTCVVFLEKGAITTNLWIYDARRDIPRITTKSNVLSSTHFEEFEKSYGSLPNGNGKRKESDRFKTYSIEQIKERSYNLSFADAYKPVVLPHPVHIIDKMIQDYQQKILALKKLRDNLPNPKNGYTKTLANTSTAGININTKRKKAH